VPHIKVEEKLHELAAATEQTFVVAAVPDDKKGGRLVVSHKLALAALTSVLEKLAASDLPNLWKPRAEQFFKSIPFPGWAPANSICGECARGRKRWIKR